MTAGSSPSLTLQPHAGHPDRVRVLTLDRPPLNILDLDTLGRLEEALAGLAEGGPPQVLLVRGAGGRAFCAGVAVEDHTPDKIATMLRRFHGALGHLRELPSVVVAVVQGHCLGGGMELAAACDMVVAADGARFGQPEIKLGCYPPYAAALYPALLGSKRTFDLLATGRPIPAGDAEAIGFVNRLAPDSLLESAVAGLLEELLAMSGAVLPLVKKAIRAGEGDAFERALEEAERIYLEELARTEDMEEGLSAFLHKRPPQWKHR